MSKMDGFARSARTWRLDGRRGLVGGGIRNGIVDERNVVEYRVESVRHDASPSCRDHPARLYQFVRRLCPRAFVGCSLSSSVSKETRMSRKDIQTKLDRSHI